MQRHAVSVSNDITPCCRYFPITACPKMFYVLYLHDKLKVKYVKCYL